LSPHAEARHRLIVIGRKKLPEIEDQHEKNWAFVQKVAHDPHEIGEELGRVIYETKTRGERHLAPARPAGEGVYALVRHADHTHLAFALELPTKPGEVQGELNIPQQGATSSPSETPSSPRPQALDSQTTRRPSCRSACGL